MATESKNDPNEAINHSLNINEVIASTSLAAESVLFSATALENPIRWGNGFGLQELAPDTLSLQEVRSLISKSVRDYESSHRKQPNAPHFHYQVFRVDRVLNARLAAHYEVHVKHMKEELGAENPLPVERLLFHGTSYRNLELICREGFNRTAVMQNAHKFGDGTYFSTEFPYSIMYSKANPSDALRYMFVVRVATGDFTLGVEGMRQPPLKPNGLRYHSLVNRLIDPTIFVVFHDAAAAPAFLVTFQATIKS